MRTGGITESSPVISGDGTIYIGINNFRSAITADGKLKWKSVATEQMLNSTPALTADGHVLYASEDGNISVLKADSSIRWYVWLGAQLDASPVIAPDGMIYVPSADGELHALQGPAGLMNSSWPMFRANPQHTGRVNAKE